jgi:hypothetical protein
MNCKNHPDKPAAGECSECGEAFCQECLSQFKEKDFCAACLQAEAAFASAQMAGGAEELARMKRTLIGCSVVLLILVIVPMLLLIYPMFKLGDIGRCRANLKTIYKEALLVYAEENGGWFPPDNNDLKPLFDQGLVKNAVVFRCPGTDVGLHATSDGSGSSQAFPPGSSYLYQGGLRLPDNKESPKPVLWDRSRRNHRGKGINVLRTDGSVKFETKELSRYRLRKTGTDR